MAPLRKLDSFSRFFMKLYRGKHYGSVSAYTPLRVPLNECKVALITTAGFFLPWAAPF